MNGGAMDCTAGTNGRKCGWLLREITPGRHAMARVASYFPAGPTEENPKMKKLSQLSTLLAASLAITGSVLAQQPWQPGGQGDQDPLVQTVRRATAQYADDVKLAMHDGYGAALGCVSGSDHGAMGVHYVNGAFNGETLSNGQLDPTKPQALIDSPNRYGLQAFYELHVWAWKDNPQGPFVDWNNHVSCAMQSPPAM
jgi:hypothetical protein